MSATSVAVACDAGTCTSPPSTLHHVSQLSQLGLDPRRAPRGVLPRHTPDQATDLYVDLRAAWFLPGLLAPIEPGAVAVPTDDRLGLDDRQARLPVHPEPGQPHPEDSVTLTQPRAVHGALEDDELLTQRQNFRGERARGRRTARMRITMTRTTLIMVPQFGACEGTS